MKLLTKEEIEAHRSHTLSGGIQGCVAGLAVSALMFKFLPRRYPSFNPARMTWSIKTALFITPPTLLTAICAEEASNNFDATMYSFGVLLEGRHRGAPALEELALEGQACRGSVQQQVQDHHRCVGRLSVRVLGAGRP